jgi:RNA polymerase sigma factor (sigma-70 family)
MRKTVSDTRARAALPPFTSCVRAFEDEFDYVFRALRRHGIAPADAEDLAQDVFLIMWRRWADYDGERPLRPWLAGIAFRLAYNHRHRRSRESPRGVLDLVGDAPNPEEALAAHRARTLVLAALADLPERHRAPVVLCDLDGLPMPEIAAILGVPLATAYTRVRRGRQAFAAEVARREDAQAAGARPLLGVAALLELERTPPPAPSPVRRRVHARVAAIALRPPSRGEPQEAAAAPPRLGIELGLCATLTVLASLPWMSPARPHADGAAATQTTAAVDVSPVERRLRPAERRRLPVFARAAATPTARAPLPALAEGMAGYWRFDDGRSAAFARDLSGRGNDCRLRGMDPGRAWAAGVHGGAIDLRGRGHLECRQQRIAASAPEELTIAAWIYRPSPQRYHTALITREPARSDRDDYFFGFYANTLKASSAAWTQTTTARFTPPPGGWAHVAMSHSADGTTLLYLDGREVAREQGNRRAVARGSRNLLIGAGHASGQTKVSQNFDGLLDELLVYERTLSPEEIAALAAGAQPPLSL